MSDTTRPEKPNFRPQRRSGAAKLFGHIKTIALIGALLLIGYWVWVGGKPNPFAQGPPPQPQTFTPESAQNVELATVASVQRQQLIAGKLKQRQATAAFDELTRDLREWEREIAAWESEGPPLLRSEEGKRLAADTTLVKQFRAVFKEERPGVEAVRAARSQAEELIFPIRESLKNADDASPPSEFAVTTLRELQSRAKNGRERYRQAREAVSVLLAQAPAAGPKTLEAVLAKLASEEARERTAAIEAAESKAREEALRLVAEEKAKVIRADGEAEAQRLRDEAAKKKQMSDLAAAKSVEEMEYRQREAAQEIARLRDVAELKRQGALVSGSVWKGTLYQNATFELTFTIASRVNDDVQVKVKQATPGDAGATLLYSGIIKGNTIRLKKPGSAEFDIEATHNPSTQTITGRYRGLPPASFNLQSYKGD